MKISIVITAYNVSSWIEQCVRSCMNQTYKNIEIIIVEDCSRDNTIGIIEELAKEDERIIIIKGVENSGAGQSRRYGIEIASGEYFLLLDGDDWLSENFIESLYLRAMQTNADIVSGGITIVGENGAFSAESYGEIITEDLDKVVKFWGEKTVFMNNKIIRKSLHDKVPYCTRRFVEDTPTIIPMLHFANYVAYTNNVGYHYRQNPSSLCHTASLFKWALFRALCCQDLIAFFKEHDKRVLEKLPIERMYVKQLDQLKQCNPTNDEIQMYQNDWNEFTKNLIINDINLS